MSRVQDARILFSTTSELDPFVQYFSIEIQHTYYVYSACGLEFPSLEELTGQPNYPARVETKSQAPPPTQCAAKVLSVSDALEGEPRKCLVR